MFAAFGPDEDMQIYGHGIRRRAASMLGGDGPRLRMAWSLLLSLPGTPVMLYGDEIGMGEDLELDGRMSVRTPMQWAAGPTGGFSGAAPDQLVRPLADGAFGPDCVNVAAQRREGDSLLRFMSRLIHQRRDTPELGWGECTLIENEPPALFAQRSDWQGSTVFVVHNLSAEPVSAELELDADVVDVDDLLELREHTVDRRPAASRPRRLRLPVAARGQVRRALIADMAVAAAAAASSRLWVVSHSCGERALAFASKAPCAPGSPGGGANRLSTRSAGSIGCSASCARVFVRPR